MKRSRWVGLIAAFAIPFLTVRAQTPSNATPPPGTSAAPAVSPGAAEVVRLAEAGTSDDVILAYIQNSTSTFDLSAEQILYLRDIGLSSPVIAAMLSRDSALRNQAQPYTYDQKLYPPTTPPQAAPGPVEAPAPEQAPPAPAEAPAPVYVASPPPEVSYFYDNLSPYGSWVQLDGVGWCWQPRVVVVNRAWRPYCDSGHWVYTDAGWFWQSDYSWGWAAFHYGRWHLHERCGWVWLPDRVWGPAWVTWRSEGEHCGWAPLPPHADFDVRFGYRFNGIQVGLNFDFGLRPDHFTFIALHDFGDHDFAHRRLPAAEVTKIYNHTTIINNYVVNNNTIVNQGIKVDRVATATHTEFRKVAIRDVPAGTPASANPRGSAKGEAVVYRPQLKAPSKPVNMVAQKVDDRHPMIQQAPVMSARPARPVMAHNMPTSSATGNRNLQSQPQTTSQHATTDRTPGYPQPQQAPKGYQAGQSAPPGASSTPGKRTAEQPKAATQTTAPTYRTEPEVQPPSRPTAAGNQAPANRQYPLHSSTPNTPTPGSQQYYPKGYYQAAETHVLPPMNAHPAESRPQPSASPRQGSGADAGTKGSGGPSRKNDQ
jgi:hypothetical protein